VTAGMVWQALVPIAIGKKEKKEFNYLNPLISMNLAVQ